MGILWENFLWMSFNVTLAVIAVQFGWLLFLVKRQTLKACFFITWLIFVPNTIYLVTDLTHTTAQLQEISPFFAPLLIIQYGILTIFGIVSFLFALYPIEKELQKPQYKLTNQNRTVILVILQFIISIGVFMGRFQRTNSWEVLTDTTNVFYDALVVINPGYLLTEVLIFGILCSALYFLFREKLIQLLIYAKVDRLFHKIRRYV